MLRVVVAASVSLMVVASVAGAQGTGSGYGNARGPEGFLVSAVPVDTMTNFDLRIPSMPLVEAVRELGRLTGLHVTIGEADREVRSVAVEGRYTASEALRIMLAGSGLVARFSTSEGTTRIARTSGADAPDSGDGRAQQLAAVVIRADAGRYTPRKLTSAMRTPTPLRDTPQSVTVIDGSLVADQGMQSFADVVRYVPGVTMGQGEGHRDAPTIRGTATTADFFVDGVRDDAQYLRDLYNVERVEAIKGPNAMVFGRGGGGGVINRVRKQATWRETRELAVTGGVHGERRVTADVGDALGSNVAVRATAMFERSDRFRDRSSVERYGVNPSLSVLLGSTLMQFSAERFSDDRTVDRGIPSFDGRPSGAPITTFFGNPDESYSRAKVTTLSAGFEHVLSDATTISNRTHSTWYDKYYQNVFPGAMNAAGTTVSMSAYSDATERQNLFNQTDLRHSLSTGGVQHRILAGLEVGRQASDRIRMTGYFEGDRTSVAVPFGEPTIADVAAYRLAPADQDARTVVGITSVYIQDQVILNRFLHAVVGARYESFDLRYINKRTDEDLVRVDRMLSPRGALILKPREAVSLYGSYSVSHLPSSGEQFAVLTATSQALEPERFINREVGAKWDLGDLALAAALYQLDRTNTTAPHPTEAGQVVQTGSQRSTGYELSATGSITPAWHVAWGVGGQHATITSRTTAAAEGKVVPLVPRTTVNFWNKYQVSDRVAVGAGAVHQAKSFAAIDNAVELPSFTRVDGAVYLNLGQALSLQLNAENLLNARYYPTSHGNNNIMPGAPRTLRVTAVGRMH